MEKLKVGDVIYTSQFGSYTAYTIDRVTEKTAFSGTKKFKIEPDKYGHYFIIGGDKWGPYYGEKENEKIKRYFLVRQFRSELEALVKIPAVSNQTSIEKIQELINAVQELKQKLQP